MKPKVKFSSTDKNYELLWSGTESTPTEVKSFALCLETLTEADILDTRVLVYFTMLFTTAVCRCMDL
jgi:hypothetical protein